MFMIKTSCKHYDIIGLAILLLGGFSAVAHAQAPPLSLPPLPGQPAAPSPLAAPASPAAATANAPNAGKIGDVNVAALDITQKKDAEAVALEPPPLPNESGDKSVSVAVASPGASPVHSPPALPTLDIEAPLPAGVGIAPSTNITRPALPLPAVAPHEPVKEVVKASGSTWAVPLAPAVRMPTLGYNYRREMLPEKIYRKSYTLDNRHLPVAVTTDDYQQLFLMSVARNDINATRAFLNRGMPVNTVNANGETALSLAQRYGAGDTAQLLMLRGAR
jgi:hypothetical protein